MTRGQAEQIEQTLRDVAAVRARTRSALNVLWFPSVLFGGLTVASAAVAFVWGPEALGWYWPFAAVLGIGLTSWYYHLREQGLGVSRRAAPYLLTAGLMLGAAMALGALGTDAVRTVGPSLAVSFGCLVFAAMSRSGWLAVLALALAGVTLALGWLHLPSAVWAIPLVYGSVSVLAGVVARATVERPA